MPGFRELLRDGAKASGNGLLTQAPPNTGAGWFTLATGAWPGVHGSTNNTFHVNGAPFATRTAALRPPACCRPRRSPSRPSAAARRSRRSSGPAARGGAIDGPTLDFRNFRSGRGVATNYISPTDSRAFISVVRPAVRPPGRLRRPARRSRGAARRRRPAGPTCPQSLQPGEGDAPARHRRPRLDKYGLNAYIYDSRDDGKARYDRVLFSRTKDGDDAVGDLKEGQWADVKVTIARRRRRSTARPARCWSRSSGSRATSRRCGCSTRR